MQEDYVTDAPYTWGFYSDFGPAYLTHVAMLNGLAPVDLTKPFRFLELGCGQGVSLNTYAACFPNAEFHGVDLNPEHVANSRRLADEGGLDNVTFHETSFERFLESETGAFDFVALHGVYSWIGPEVRRQVREIVDRKLRPGGYAYLSYNALPGWAPLLPLRQIMLDYTHGKEGSTLDHVQHGLAYLKYLRDNGSAYFANNTAAHQKLDQLLEYDPHYIAHEFFHAYWSCFYFADVARDVQECGLAFAGSVPIALNIRELSIPKKFHDLLGTATDRTVYETHKGFVLNEMFRRDLYAKIPVGRVDANAVQAWQDVLFGPLILRESLRTEIRFPAGDVAYTGPIYPILTDILLDGAMRFGDLLADPKLAPFGPGEILNSMHLLCAGGQFGVLQTPLLPRPDPSGGWRIAAPFNRALLESRLFAEDRLNLASPVVGTGVGIDLIAGLAALALDRADVDKAEAWAWDHLKRNGRTLRVGGQPVEDPDQEREVLKTGFERFRSVSLPRLAEYGVLEPRD